MSQDANNQPVPDFTVKSLGCLCAVLSAIAFVSIPVFSLLYKWKDIVSAWIRPVSFAQMMQSVSPILSVMVWPLFILFVIYLFRDNLGAVVDAAANLFRAWNGQDAVRVRKDNGEGEPCGSVSGLAMTTHENKETEMINFLQRKLNRPIMRGVQLFGMDCRFDGVYQEENRFVGIEVKLKGTSGAIKERVYEISAEYARLKVRDRRRFSLLLYVPESEFEKCAQWRHDFNFKVSVVTVTKAGEILLQ